jgi:hypothetical protein
MKNVRVELANKTPRPINDPSPLEKRAAFLHVCGPSQSFLSIFFIKKKKTIKGKMHLHLVHNNEHKTRSVYQHMMHCCIGQNNHSHVLISISISISISSPEWTMICLAANFLNYSSNRNLN